MKSISLLNISFAYSGTDDLFTDLSYSVQTIYLQIYRTHLAQIKKSPLSEIMGQGKQHC